MTKRRSPLTFERALTKIAAQIGWEKAAEIVGQSVRTVRNWSDGDTGAGVRPDAALKLDVAYRAAGGDGAPLLQCYATRVETDLRVACADSVALAKLIAVAAKEGGEAIQFAVLAASPGASEADRVRAVQEIEESIAAQTNTLTTLRAGRPVDEQQEPGR